jgi:antitoxin component YwqK of YwqJK toxin-antitoxin module
LKNIFITGFFLLWTAFAFAQSDSIVQNGHQVFYYPNGKIASEGTMRDGKPDGYWKSYDEYGNLVSEGNRKNFQLDSLWKFYDENGKLKLSITYKNGKKNGYRTTYLEDRILVDSFANDVKNGYSKVLYPDGKLKRITPFKNGLEDGVEKEYAEDGRLIMIATYTNGFLRHREYMNALDDLGRKQGLWKEFYPDGKLKMAGNYLNGLKHGYFKYYDEEGNLIKIEKYINDILQEDPPELAEYEIRIDYYPDGKIKVVGSYKDSVAEGIRREYSHDGKITDAYIMHRGRVIGHGIIDEQGQKQGPWKEYYMDGTLRAEGTYTNNVRTGLWKFYHPNGRLEQIGKYDAKGRGTGNWKWYYDNGALRRDENLFEGIHEGDYVEYDRDSTILLEGNYVDGIKEGFWREGEKGYREEGNYLEGVREGVWKYYYPGDILYFEGAFIDGTPDGLHKWYYKNGKLMKQGRYMMGLREGDWKYYNEEGKVYLIIKYEDGIEKEYNATRIEPELTPDDMTE